jgi:hypothetical protein
MDSFTVWTLRRLSEKQEKSRLSKEADEVKSIRNGLDALGSRFQTFDDSLDLSISLNHSDLDQLMDQLEKLINCRPETPQIRSILNHLELMKKSKKEILFDRIVNLSSILGLALSVLQYGLPRS